MDQVFFVFSTLVVLSLILYQDTAGSERFESVSTLYYRGAKAAVVCYGKTSCNLFLSTLCF